MELKDTYYRNAKMMRRTKKTPIIGMLKRCDGQKRHERQKTAGCAGFQVSTSCLSWVAALTNALIRFLAEFRGAFMCVCVCAGGQRGRKRV